MGRELYRYRGSRLVYHEKDGQVIYSESRDGELRTGFQIMTDIPEFVDQGSGQRIGGRRQWREHLKANDLIERGHSELASTMDKKPERRGQMPSMQQSLKDALDQVRSNK